MSPEAQKVRDIFVAAVKIPPEQWQAFLEEACAGDDELRRQVSDLLQEHQQAGSFLDQPAAHVRATGEFDPGANGVAAAPEGPSTVIGPYKLLELIGEGGMGAVWMAEQREPVQRKVALKIIKAGMDTRQVVARFEAERQALALMDHPNIAKVFDGGTTAGGRPYFVMELVKGVPITRYCDEHRLTPRERLELFVPVCQAIQHAHTKGIIHRDVKPANVLVAPYDGRPVPKVIDFGVAKATGQRLTEGTLFTGLGAVVGTLEYMSPEQAELNNQDIDTRSDIYSLGVLLFELLTGTTPLSRERVRQAAFTELLRAIREEEPPRPSTRLTDSKETLAGVAAVRHTEPARLVKTVRGELDWIVMKALEKDRRRRYETANGLATDVQHYLADEPVQACPPSAWYRFGKFARRKKAGIAIAGLVLLLIVFLGAGGGWLVGDRATRQREAEGKVLAALEAAEPRLRDGHPWDPALASAAQRVEVQLDTGILGPEVRRRAEQLRRDVRMLAELDEIRLRRAESKDGEMWDTAGTEARYAAAFSAYGVDVMALEPPESAARIRDSAIRAALVAGLDAWMQVKTVQGTERTRLRAVVDAADDSAWLRAFRAAALARDERELQALAGRAEALDQPPGVLAGLGSVLVDAGLWKQAEAVLRQAQARHPGDFWINYNLGHLLHFCLTPQNTEAVGYLRAAVAIRPTSAEARSMLGHALFHGGDRDKGIAGYQQAIALDPKFAVAHVNLAGAFASTGRLEEAIAEYREVIWLLKDFPEARRDLGNALDALAEVLLRQGKHAEAAKVAEEMVVTLPRDNGSQRAALLLTRCAQLAEKDEKLPQAGRVAVAKTYADRARELMQEAEKQFGEEPAFWSQRGDAALRQGQWDEAIAHYTKALALKPDDPHLWSQRGGAYLSLHRWDWAAADFTKAIALKPDDEWLRHERCYAYLWLHQFDKAVADCTKGIELNPRNWDFWDRRGWAYTGLGQHDKALADYTQAIALRPPQPWPWVRRGQLYAELGQWAKAAADYAKAVELAPDEADAWYLYALVRLGAADTKGYRDVCASILERFGKAEDPDTEYWAVWACVLAPDGVAQSELLVALAGKSLAKAPANYDYLTTLGAAFYRAGRYEEAAKRLDEAITVYKPEARFRQTVAYSWFFLAMAHQRLGQADEARKWLDKAVQWMDQAGQEKEQDAASKTPMPWNRRLSLQLLRNEAETLIGAAKQK
jgi:serine/threonine protein kinase/tetratricopeptide (TPR) repeat protein